MVPKDLQGKPWSTVTAGMVLNRIKRDVAEMVLAKDMAKGVLPGGRVTRWYKKDGKDTVETQDYSEATSVAVDPVLAAMKTSPRDCRVLTRRLYAKFLKRRREECVDDLCPYSEDDPMGQNQRGGFRVADHVPWHDDELPSLHELGMYLDWQPKDEAMKADDGTPAVQPETVRRGPGRPRKVVAVGETG